MVRADIFQDSLAVFNKERGEPEFYEGEPQNQAGSFSPPKAAKFVRTIFNIEHILEKVNLSASPLRGSAAKLNGNFQQKLNFWFCVPLLAGQVKENFKLKL